MHVFLLILAIAGNPERIGAICETYKQCSDTGAAMADTYAKQLGTPAHFSYRVMPALIVPEGKTT